MVLADERTRLNMTDFSIRMICELSGTSDGRRGIVLKYSILIFPASWAEMQENPDSRFGSYPGIRIVEGTFPLIPRPSSPWGCPVIPFILPGAPFEELATAPTGRKLREAIAAIMRRTATPATLRHGGEVVARWEHVRTHPRELEGPLTVPAVTWPIPATDAEASSPQEGKKSLISYLKFSLSA
jgi:hypothetical protein